MGIRGLTTFMRNRSAIYLEDHKLHGSYLVIDGHSVGIRLYLDNIKGNPLFGGDYDEYAEIFSNFLDKLLQCNITPIVLFDGALEHKKLETKLTRTQQKIKKNKNCNTFSKSNMTPPFLAQIMKDVLTKKKIRFAQCVLEADNAIAFTAKVLNCAVLSGDSDFYIFDVLFIPFEMLKLELDVLTHLDQQTFALPCKIYQVDKLLNQFKGLDKSKLGLAAILLGNDYANFGSFNAVYAQMNKKMHKPSEDRIEHLFHWLGECELHDAITRILMKVQKSVRNNLVQIINAHINGYQLIPTDILTTLGFSHEYNEFMSNYLAPKAFKFIGDVQNLQLASTSNYSMSEIANNVNDESKSTNPGTSKSTITTSNNIEEETVRNLPSWFIKEHLMGHFCGHLLAIHSLKIYIPLPTIEDFSLPCNHNTSLKVIGILAQLLACDGQTERDKGIKCYIRGETDSLVCRYVKSEAALSVSLHNLREISLSERNQILRTWLGIANGTFFDNIPKRWQLYFGSINYWVQEAKDTYYRLDYYLYALLFCILRDVIYKQIGSFRNLSKFYSKYNQQIKAILENRKKSNPVSTCSTSAVIVEAYDTIDKDDCLLAANFFIKHSEPCDKRLQANSFKKRIVHIFCDFQNCFFEIINLNRLLGDTVEHPFTADLLNGTFFYNIVCDFETRSNIEEYVKNYVLHQSHSIQHLFNTFVSKIRPLMDMLPAVYSNKKQKM